MASGPLTDRPFSNFQELSTDTVSFLKEVGFEYATPVQAAVLPLFSANKDVVVDACTGSGKTLAFLLPLLEKLRRRPSHSCKSDVSHMSVPKEETKTQQVLAVVVAPTRELATQTFTVAHPFVEKLTSFSLCRLVGGSPASMDVALVNENGGNILVGTPGRINDIIKRNTLLNFNTVELLVLDEADRLLDLGFERQLLEIVHALPKQRRTGLFSATQTEACEALIKAGLRNPIRVNVTTTLLATSDIVEDFSQKTPQSLTISAVVVPLDQKFNQLVRFLIDRSHEKIIVYGLTCASIDYWFYVLRKFQQLKGMTVRALHGRMQQNGRERAIQAFAADPSGVLLATDVAARGLDIPEVHWVVQLDAPQNPNAFVHRVGRTARMGRKGEALIYLAPNEGSYIKFLQMKKVPVKKEQPVEAIENFTPWLRKLSETEREAMVKGIAAYTSYIRAYSNHHCPYIFTLKELDFGKLAYAFGLLYLPGMKEIKVKAQVDFVPSKVDPWTIKFVDKARETERQKLLTRLEKEAKLKSKEKKPGNKRSRKELVASNEQQSKTKRTRNDQKRDLEELERDYKIYRLEKNQKKRTPNPRHREEDSGDDFLDDRVKIPTTETAPIPLPNPTTRLTDSHQPTKMHSKDHEGVPVQMMALKESLRKKLQSMQRRRQAKKTKTA